MLNKNKFSVEKYIVSKDNYIVFPDALNLSELIENEEAWIEAAINKLKILDEELLREYIKKDIFKIPKYEVIMDWVIEFSEKIKKQIKDKQKIRNIEKYIMKFSDDFGPLYSTHMELLCSRLDCLKQLKKLYAPDVIRIGQECLCAKEAVIMLSLIKICTPSIDMEDCFKE